MYRLLPWRKCKRARQCLVYLKWAAYVAFAAPIFFLHIWVPLKYPGEMRTAAFRAYLTFQQPPTPTIPPSPTITAKAQPNKG